MKNRYIKKTIICVIILYLIYIFNVIRNDKEFILEKLNDRFIERAIPECFVLSGMLLLLTYIAINEKNQNMKKGYLGLIGVCILKLVTTISAHIKLLTLPAFTVLFMWFISYMIFGDLIL